MKPGILLSVSFIILIAMSGCGKGELFGLSVAPSSTITPTFTPTITPKPITNTPTVTIVTGTIVDSTGLPLADNPVQLYKNENQDVFRETKTNAKGEYTFEDIHPGSYRIRYDIVLSSTYVLHYYTDEFKVESGTITRQDIVHNN